MNICAVTLWAAFGTWSFGVTMVMIFRGRRFHDLSYLLVLNRTGFDALIGALIFVTGLWHGSREDESGKAEIAVIAKQFAKADQSEK
jgi:hypothetical protein